MSDLVFQLTAPQPASSLFFAHRKAKHAQQTPLRALYSLHKKWREAAVYTDQHQAVTTLNWWHHELEKVKTNEINHPALVALKPWFTGDNGNAFYNDLQALLHGHMHWHHITRIEQLAQLEPIIDAIGGSFVKVWLQIIGVTNEHDYALSAGRALWWIDQTRHIGHGLTPSRLWIPMAWLKELNLPAHLILQKDASAEQRAQNGAALVALMLEKSQQAVNYYQGSYKKLPKKTQKNIKSIHTLLHLRGLLLQEIQSHQNDVWQGLMSITPRKKWWEFFKI